MDAAKTTQFPAMTAMVPANDCAASLAEMLLLLPLTCHAQLVGSVDVSRFFCTTWSMQIP